MINRDRLVELFCTLVSIDSPSGREREMGDFLTLQLEGLGFQVTEDEAGASIGGNCGNLYGFLPGDLPLPPLLLSGHMDTVEPARGKQAVVHPDGRITAAGGTVLGADDMAGVAAILEAVRAAREGKTPHRPIEVLLSVSEETYCSGIEHFDFGKLQSREGYVLDLSGPVGEAAYKAPSILSFCATVQGRAAHAGFAPEQGIHAVQAAAKGIAGLGLGRLDEDTVLNIGPINGGTATNIIPDRCTVEGEIRSYDHAKALAQWELVERTLGEAAAEVGATVQFHCRVGCRAYETPPDHPVVRRFEAVCRERGLKAKLRPTFGGSDQNRLAQEGMAGLVLANAMNACHSLEEYTTVDELCRIAALVEALICREEPVEGTR